MRKKSEEQVLIERALNGHQGSFKILYSDHVDGLFAFLNQFLSDREQVKECTQRAFIKAFRKLHTFQGNARFKTWLFSIAYNEMRVDMRNKIHFETLENMDGELSHNSEEQIPEHWYEAKEAIRELQPDKKIVFLLYIAEGYSHKEIGQILNIEESTSRVILHRTKKELNKSMQS